MADYRKMWEELGMDVELHDQLCAVLPQAFGDVFLSQENRPDSMDYYNMVVADIHGIRPAELIEHQKKRRQSLRYILCICTGRDRICGRCDCNRIMRRFPVLGSWRRESPSCQYLSTDQGICWCTS